MFIVKLSGGLGNQMFQYAAARCLAEEKKTFVKSDFVNRTGDTPRDYSLSCFNALIGRATREEIGPVRYLASRYSIGKLVGFAYKLLPVSLRRYVKESHFYYFSNFFSISDGAYLDGYWQSEKYFKRIKDIIIQEFSLKEQCLEKIDKTLLNFISSSNSVSLHIRRGDYVSNKKTNLLHGICTSAYYCSALEYIASFVTCPQVFIFSDDIGWVKNNLKFIYPVTFVSDVGHADYEEIFLMSQCKHNIISNSSFSWWGAWLNQNQNKIVVAPSKWFNDEEFSTRDLIPNSWIKI